MQGEHHHTKQPDIVLVGAGIMSATLGVLLKELNPQLTISIFESLDQIAGESSDGWNNAGTGHAALCELNYTPERADGSIETKKALEINEAFEISKQLWTYLVTRGVLGKPGSFIREVPHLSFVSGEKNVAYLRKRFAALSGHHLFAEMEYSEDRYELEEWMPLIMQKRDDTVPVAATRMDRGTDVDFGSLTRLLINHLKVQPGVALHLRQRITDVTRETNGRWLLDVEDKVTGAAYGVSAKFVFLGAGGGALPLLQKSGIPEGKGFGGFPVSGQWLRCDNPIITERHFAKVYGRASLGAPPMSVPHLDTRIIDGKRSLLFGPFAGFTTKFLKRGSYLDFPLSMKPDNLVPMLWAGARNVDLTKYLIGQVLQSPWSRILALREYMPSAKMKDWYLERAGQRVQVIKKDPVKGGILQFGTEVVAAADGSLAALLGASPGASTAVSIMLELLESCFPAELASDAWQAKLREMIPSFGQSLIDDADLFRKTQARTTELLELWNDEKPAARKPKPVPATPAEPAKPTAEKEHAPLPIKPRDVPTARPRS
ncbi:MAG: malate dehydrogenase (quinone) [Chthoniobacteraceae bacterium]